MPKKKRINGSRPLYVVMDEATSLQTPFEPRYNGYRCEKCKLIYLTVDLDEGTTPMFMSCFRTEGCDGRAVSLMYPEGVPPIDLPLLIHWYKPSRFEIRRVKHPGLRDHLERGGLMRRAAPDAPEWVKKLA